MKLRSICVWREPLDRQTERSRKEDSKMAYRSDPDLDFLRDVPSSGLDLLVETLITDSETSNARKGTKEK